MPSLSSRPAVCGRPTSEALKKAVEAFEKGLSTSQDFVEFKKAYETSAADLGMFVELGSTQQKAWAVFLLGGMKEPWVAQAALARGLSVETEPGLVEGMAQSMLRLLALPRLDMGADDEIGAAQAPDSLNNH